MRADEMSNVARTLQGAGRKALEALARAQEEREKKTPEDLLFELTGRRDPWKASTYMATHIAAQLLAWRLMKRRGVPAPWLFAAMYGNVMHANGQLRQLRLAVEAAVGGLAVDRPQRGSAAEQIVSAQYQARIKAERDAANWRAAAEALGREHSRLSQAAQQYLSDPHDPARAKRLHHVLTNPPTPATEGT